MEITSLMLQSLVLPAAVIAILFALWLASDVLRRDKGTPAMQDVAGMIFEGAIAFMRRQYITISVLSVAMAVLIGALIAFALHRLSEDAPKPDQPASQPEPGQEAS